MTDAPEKIWATPETKSDAGGISIAIEISGPFVLRPRAARHGPMLKFQWAWFGVYLINYGFIRMLNDIAAKEASE